MKDPKNYRSLSLMSLFGKVLEKLVSEQLLAHVLPAMSESQHGFIPRRSCATNLVTLLKTAWENSVGLYFFRNSNRLYIYTDFTAAFQSVNQTLLLHKLRHFYYIYGTAHQWFASYLTDRQQRVIVNGKASSWTPVRSGTPEGGLLSPLLFAMYINDLSDQIKSPCLMFAEDVKINRKINCTTDVVLLQEDLSRLCRWSQIWKLNLNATKCKSFRMTLKKSPIRVAYFIGNTALEHVDTIRDLGVILDKKLTFRHHIESSVKKANRSLGLLIRTFQKPKTGGHINLSAARVSYYAHVRSVLEYGSVVWSGRQKPIRSCWSACSIDF